MKYEVKNSFSTIQINDIEGFEADIGFLLPSDYKHFLLQHNGGSICPSLFRRAAAAGCAKKVDDNIIFKYSHSIDFLFGIMKPDDPSYSSYSISIERNSMLADERLPEDILPIATDSGGNIIFIKLTGDTACCVYLWLHYELVDADDSGNLPECYNSYYVASSFTEFLESLF